ncbi:UbiA prenyltransferase family protein [Thermoproteota archaeon]
MTQLVVSRFSRASVYTWATFTAVLLSTNGLPNLMIIVLASISTFFMSLAVYILNDIVDLEVDKINAPKRLLVSKSLKKRDVLILFLFLNIGGMGIGYWLGFYTFLITVGELILGITYSIKPFNFKDRFLAKTLIIGGGGILASIFGGVATNNVNGTVIYAALLFIIFLFATSPINDLADYIGDKAQKRKTIPIIIGPQNTIKLAIISAVSPFISSLIVIPMLNLTILLGILYFFLGYISIKLLLPLLNNYSDLKKVRIHHKRMVPLHFFLQGALVLGTISIPI